MTPTPAVAPQVPNYANHGPYITPTEYLASPTGVDTSALVPGGSPSQNTAALVRQIARASSWADQLCNQVLAATTDIQADTYRIRRDGTVWVPCDNTPIVYVTDVTWGWAPSAMTSMSDLSNLWIGRKVVQIPLTANVMNIPPSSVLTVGGRPFVKVTYVNGYANTTLASSASINATQVTAKSPLGIVPGLQMRLDDGLNPVYVTVAQTYVIGSTTVPLTAALTVGYPSGCSFSALPEAIKQAVISLTTALIKTRGDEALVLDSMSGQPTRDELTSAGGMYDFDVAMDQLSNFVRVM